MAKPLLTFILLATLTLIESRVLAELTGTHIRATYEPIRANTGIDDTIEPADRFADGMAAVNSVTCMSPTIFDPTRHTLTDVTALAYLRTAGFRHVRDGFSPDCYHQPFFDAWWNRVVRLDGISRIGGVGLAYTRDQLDLLRSLTPGFEALEFANEWDIAAQPASGYLKLGLAAKAGDDSIELSSKNGVKWTVPGQKYTLGTGQNQEVITAAPSIPTSLSTLSLEYPLREAHSLGSELRRVGDFVSDALLWYQTYAPEIRSAEPHLALLGPSMAHPINSSKFLQAGISLRPYIDILDAHPYPINGANPEGTRGDGYAGPVRIKHPPCSFDGTSYSFMFNTICEGQLVVDTKGVRLPTWITEYAYQAVPVGAAHSEVWPLAIPDDVAVDYLASSEFFALTHGVGRLYWFQIRDGTSGATSSFCPYGLIRDSSCSPAYGNSPAPKPEFLALMSLIQYFSDPDCAYPKCNKPPQHFSATWSPAQLPLNTVNVEFADGRVVVVFWLGERSYDTTSTASCAARTGCYIPVEPRKEKLESPLLTSARMVLLTGIDDSANDPLPERQAVIPKDGMGVVNVIKCPITPVEHAEFGCLLPSHVLHPVNGTVQVMASRRMQWIVIEPNRQGHGPHRS